MSHGLGRAAVLALVLGGCSSSSTNEPSGACETGATRSCIGPAQCKGGQFCGAEGKWEACACGAGGAGGAAGSGATSGGGSGGTSTGGSGGTSTGGSGGTSTGGSGGSGGGTAGPAAGYLLWGKDAGDFAIVPVDMAGLTGSAVTGAVPGCAPRALVGDGSTNALHLFCATNNGANVYFVEPISLQVETTIVTPLAKGNLVAVAFDWVGGGSYHVLWQPAVGSAGTVRAEYTQGAGWSDSSMSPPTGMRGTFIDAKKEFVLWSSTGACERTSYASVVTNTKLAGFVGLLCRSLVLDGSVWRMGWGSEANDTAKVCTFAAEPADATVPGGTGWTADTCKDFSYGGGDWRFRGYLRKP